MPRKIIQYNFSSPGQSNKTMTPSDVKHSAAYKILRLVYNRIIKSNATITLHSLYKVLLNRNNCTVISLQMTILQLFCITRNARGGVTKD